MPTETNLVGRNSQAKTRATDRCENLKYFSTFKSKCLDYLITSAQKSEAIIRNHSMPMQTQRNIFVAADLR